MCIFVLGSLGFPLSSLFCFYIRELPCLSTLGYVNKPMVGIGMHIVGLHCTEKKRAEATTCSVFWYFWDTNIPLTWSHLSSYLTLTLQSFNRCAHEQWFQRRKDAYRNAFHLQPPTPNLQLSFLVEHEHSHLQKPAVGIRRSLYKTSWTSRLICVLWTQRSRVLWSGTGSLMWNQP